MTLRAGLRRIGRVALALSALLGPLLLPSSAPAAEHGRPGLRPAEPSTARSIALSIRIAQARNRPAAKRYYQSLARQHRARHGRRAPRASKRLTGNPQAATLLGTSLPETQPHGQTDRENR